MPPSITFLPNRYRLKNQLRIITLFYTGGLYNCDTAPYGELFCRMVFPTYANQAGEKKQTSDNSLYLIRQSGSFRLNP